MNLESKIENLQPEADPPQAEKWAMLTAKNDINAADDQFELALGELPNSTGEQGAIESHDLRNVSNGILWKPRGSRGKQDITRSLRPSKIAGQRNAHNGSDPASVESLPLDYDDRSSKPGTGTRWSRQVRPVNVALGDYHSTRLSVRLAAAEMAGSGRVSTSPHTWFIASVTASGSWRARYSATASAYTWLLDFLWRRDRRSASAYILSGMEMAVFIPKV